MPSLRRWLANMPRTAVACAFLAGATVAQEPDLLDQTKRLETVAAQAAEADIRLQMSEAVRTGLADKPKALELYRAVLKKLEADKAMSEDKRGSLVRVVKDRIKAAEVSATADADEAAVKKARDKREADQKAAEAKIAEDAAKIKRGLQSVAELRQDGKFAEANAAAKNLLRDFPTNPSVQVLNGVSSTLANADEARAIQAQTDERRVALAMEQLRSNVPATDNVEFPKDWAQKSAKRLASKVSPAELKLIQALATPVPAEFKAARLQDAIDYLSQKTGQTILLDKAMLDEAGTSYDTPVSFNTRSPVATRSILKSILSQANLAYVVRDGAIQVVTPQRAKDMMVTKAYYVGDLLGAGGLPMFGPHQQGPFADPAQTNLQVSMILEMIRTSIDPMSWNGQGGTGTVGYNAATMSLVVRQSAEVQALIGSRMAR